VAARRNTLMRYGIAELIPRQVELVHGPGARYASAHRDSSTKRWRLLPVLDVTFRVPTGIWLRVPGTKSRLLQCEAQGGDVRIAYSPMEAVKIARKSFPQGGFFVHRFITNWRPRKPWPV